jgi:hypothetical protein
MTSLPSFSSDVSPSLPSKAPTSSYNDKPMAWIGMLRFEPSGPLARFKKVRRTRAGKNLGHATDRSIRRRQVRMRGEMDLPSSSDSAVRREGGKSVRSEFCFPLRIDSHHDIRAALVRWSSAQRYADSAARGRDNSLELGLDLLGSVSDSDLRRIDSVELW